jgi:hypothetical protein
VSEVDVDRALTEAWQTLVAGVRPDPDLPAAMAQSHGGRITRPVLWAELEDVRLAMAELRAAIDGDRADAGTLATTRWSVKDVVAHVASWAAEFREQIERVARREPFDYLITFTPQVGPTEWNEREVERRREFSLDAAFDEFARETARVQELALSLSDAVLFTPAELPLTPDGTAGHRWRRALADLMLMKCWHDRYHLDRLREIVGVRSAE